MPPAPRARMLGAGAATVGLFLAVQVGALLLVRPFVGAGFRAVEDPTDPRNSLLYLAAILVATAAILVVVRYGATRLLRLVVTAMSGVLALYVFSVVIPPLDGHGGPVAIALAGALAVLLYAYPEWYVIDAGGVIIAAGGAGLFGISFSPLPAIVLLVVLAIYDAISVYRTKHMLTLAESVTDLKLPLVLVIPLSWSYSFRDATGMPGGEDGGRDAFFVGLGDTVIPAVLTASGAFFLEAPALPVPVVTVNAPAAGALVGTLVAVAGLLWLVSKGRAHAGLPLLNGGAIAGYLVGALLSGIPVVEAVGLAAYL